LAARSNPEAEAIKQMMLDHINRASAQHHAAQGIEGRASQAGAWNSRAWSSRAAE
jgi:hypothetical protein